MATTKKLNETGWFYHAPAKPVRRDEPIPVPPASQIPGLSDLSAAPPEEHRKVVIMESDSPYIRMAKMGGRPDLLRFRSPKPPSDEPKLYPRNEWFYQEDNKMEEDQQNQNQQKSDYVFTLPNYMVHQEAQSRPRQEAAGGEYCPKRLPYGYDKTTVYEREGGNATDKTMALEEQRPHGYGIRAGKQHGKPVKAKHPMPERERGKAPAAQHDDGIPRPKPMKEMKEEAHPPMSKVLANGYAKDWHDERDRWEASQKKPDSRGKVKPSEYQSSMQAGATPIRSANSKKGNSATSSKRGSTNSETTKTADRQRSGAWK